MAVALPVVENPPKITRRIALSVERSERLQRLARFASPARTKLWSVRLIFIFS